MTRSSVLAAMSVAFLLCGCSTTKTITLHSDKKMATGEQMSCIYHAEDLYCAATLIKAEEVDKLQVMNRVVSVVHDEQKDSDMKEGGAFSTKFRKTPTQYSLWNCTNTGAANPAIECVLLHEADQKVVSDQEGQIKLNESDERKLQSGLTAQEVVAKCGPPVDQKDDIISHTIYFRSVQSGQDVEVRFSTLEKPTQLDHIESVQDSKAHEFIPSGIFWNNYARIGNTNEERVADVRQYFPCILK